MAYPKISKRKDGRFSANVPLGKDPITGKTKRKTVCAKTKNELKAKIDQIEKDIHSGVLIPTMKPLKLKDWCEQWFNLFGSELSKGTIVRYRDYCNLHIIPALGAMDLSKITPLQCQNFVNYLSLEKNLHQNTINALITFFKSLLQKAVTLELLGKNPAENIIKPKRTQPKLKPFNEKEVINFLKICDPHKTIDNLCKFDLFTGLRESEILALTWDDINNNELIVSHQFHRDKSDTTFYPTKNKRLRKVGLSNEALKILEDQRKVQSILRFSKKENYNNSLNLIFTDDSGNRLHKNTVLRHFKKLATLIDCPEVRFHDLRHTFAILNIKAGVDIKTISESLGHHSVAFTLDQYAYVTDNMRQEAANKMDNFLKNYM